MHGLQLLLPVVAVQVYWYMLKLIKFKHIPAWLCSSSDHFIACDFSIGLTKSRLHNDCTVCLTMQPNCTQLAITIAHQ